MPSALHRLWPAEIRWLDGTGGGAEDARSSPLSPLVSVPAAERPLLRRTLRGGVHLRVCPRGHLPHNDECAEGAAGRPPSSSTLHDSAPSPPGLTETALTCVYVSTRTNVLASACSASGKVYLFFIIFLFAPSSSSSSSSRRLLSSPFLFVSACSSPIIPISSRPVT